MKKFICLFASLVLLLSCDKDVNNVYVPVLNSTYHDDFIEKIGQPESSHEWGDWTLTPPAASTRGDFIDVTYPSDAEINNIIQEFSILYNDTNMVKIPNGDYWVKTIYKDTLSFYIPPDWHGSWFYGYQKMKSINVYDKSTKRYQPIEGIDSLALIENDLVTPQFAYFNEIYNENHFEQRIIEHDGIYYIGFDLYADGFIKGGAIYYDLLDERDYIYNDWIIMLIPAVRCGQETVYDEKRVMCEDLSSNHDFDFNDLVFDVGVVKLDGVLKTKITIQAIGSECQMSIANHNVHDLFHDYGYINTYNDRSSEPVSFYLDEVITDIRDINVLAFHSTKVYNIACDKGAPTQKICVPTNVPWTHEGVIITNAYPLFKDYLTNPSIDWWEKINEPLVIIRIY